MLEYPLSPLFPAVSLTSPHGNGDTGEFLMPQLPESPVVQTSSIQVYIVPTEKHLFVPGFKPSEYEGLPPTLLRGCLVLRVLKSTKIKSVSLLFKGSQRTDWPEGIPPKKSLYAETQDIVSHTWPFYQMESPMPNCGADLYIPARGTHTRDVSHLSLADMHNSSVPLLAPVDLMPSFAASLIKRATSPLGGALAPSNLSLAPTDSMADLTAVLSSLSLATLGDNLKPGDFAPGDYVYNFEHPIPALSPESTHVNFGKVAYHLETNIVRLGTFKSNLAGRIPVKVVRIPCESSVEENEPIVIERDWEDQLRYEIVVGGKSVVLDTYVPLVFRFIPLYGKVSLHRIRVYITENCNYYCLNRSVHREEPIKKFLLLEHKAKKNKSLLSKSGGLTDEVIENDEILPRELEFQLFIPSMINKKYNYCIHPDTALENIKCDHWIKISLRISKQDPNVPDKRKHFEILIDSPIHLCSPLAAHCNTLLPAYDLEPELLPKYTPNSPPMSPEVTAVNHSLHAGHLILSALSHLGDSHNRSALSPQRLATPIEFQHIASLSNNDDPIERDNDLHLEANLYQPQESEVLDQLGSPQAKPFTPVGSPQMYPNGARSPSIPPLNIRHEPPSLEPPAFGDASPPVDQSLPPAYCRSPSLSLSPLRIDSSAGEARDSRSKTGSNNASPLSLLNQPATNIKTMLNKQLDRRDRNSNSDRDSVHSTPSQHSRKSAADSEETKLEKTDSKPKSELNGSGQSTSKEVESVPAPNGTALSPTEPTVSAPQLDEPKTNILNKPGDDSDITDIGSRSDPNHLRVDPTGFGLSRRSSLSLATLSMYEAPLDQTLPLLSLSSTSVNDTERLLFDGGRRLSSVGDLVDYTVFGNTLDEYSNANQSLSRLRNPRIKKHYQDKTMDDVSQPFQEEKVRQKSFGVVPQLSQLEELNLKSRSQGSSDESEMTVSPIQSPNGNKSDTYMEPVDLQEVSSS